MPDPLITYRLLAQLGWPKSYGSKFLLVAWLGLQVPLLTLGLLLFFGSARWPPTGSLLAVSLLAVLAGIGLTLRLQRQLLAPLRQTAQALAVYQQQGICPHLPLAFSDEAGQLLANAQSCLSTVDERLKRKSEALAIIGHDLGSHLNTMLLLSDLMTQQLAQPAPNAALLQKYLCHLQHTVHAQSALLNHSLNLALSEQGRLLAQPSTIDLFPLLQQVFTLTQVQAEQKGIRYELALRPWPAVSIRVDVPKTVQLLSNLVGNAIKFTPPGGRIELNGHRQQQQLEIWVKDSGMGLEPCHLDSLFEAFSPSQRLGTAQEPGLGLGLWICLRFAEAQGGTIGVESQVGQGSCFTLRLPQPGVA